MTAHTRELKPCPFCGAIPTLERHLNIVGIVCGNNCDQQGLAIAFSPDMAAQAIAAWNQRPTEQALAQALTDYANHARESGWHNLADEIERRRDAALAKGEQQ